MGSRVIRRLLALCAIAALALSPATSFAASKSPTAKPTVKATAKATVKATAKATAKPTAKPTTKATTKATAKPTATATTKASAKPTPTKKAVVKKKKKHAKVRVSPSPDPSWPPKGFQVEGEVYAKVPGKLEMVSIISANDYLENRIKSCTTYICGKVQVASETGCIWWEVNADLYDYKGRKLGVLTSAFNGTAPREFKTFILVSPESAANGPDAKIASVLCHHADRDQSVQSVSYKKVTD